jgi:altronate dehydratase large subunit
MTNLVLLRQLHPSDNVAVALTDLTAHTIAAMSNGDSITLRETIPLGHKVALTPVLSGQTVVKYGAPIGTATENIAVGTHVHTHNLVSSRTGASDESFKLGLTVGRQLAWAPPELEDLPTAFQGYRRPDGLVGTRNHVLILPSVFCANVAAVHIAAAVPSALALRHSYGCGQLDVERTRDILFKLGRHPNVAAAVVVGLGCETVQADVLATAIAKTGKPVTALCIQDEGGTLPTIARGVRLAAKMSVVAAGIAREPCSISELIVATECGGSDATSGLAANPVLGWVADRVVAAGGTVLLSETAEIIGAEHLLAQRAVTPEVGRNLKSIVTAVERSALEQRVDLRSAQPTPGNIAGGLTTLEEKSLGCVAKGGTAPLQGVLGYGECPSSPGLNFMDTSGHDAESVTGMVAGGAQLVLFSTGRGTPLGAPVSPVIKISANPQVTLRMSDHIDLSLVPVLRGEATTEALGRKLWGLLLDVVNGQPTAAELLGHHEMVIARAGPSV